MSSPTHASAPVRHALRLVLGLVLLDGVACSSPSASEAPPSEPSAASTQPSEAPAVGDGQEWIVFQGAPPGLSLIQPDGAGNHVILGPPGDQVHPDWSPDGSRIAYVQTSMRAALIHQHRTVERDRAIAEALDAMLRAEE
jgi:hypothetical protein